jgi:hypothetical protein
MSWIDALSSGIDRLVKRRRLQRKRREGRWDWWDDEWRVERARHEGIRYSDDELRRETLAALNTGRPPLWSFNEYKRAWELLDQAFDAGDPEWTAVSSVSDSMSSEKSPRGEGA